MKALDVIAYVQGFDGYAWAGGMQPLGEHRDATRAAWDRDGTLPDDDDAVRACLFLWVRADRHGGGYGPSERDVPWLTALMARLDQTPDQTPDG